MLTKIAMGLTNDQKQKLDMQLQDFLGDSTIENVGEIFEYADFDIKREQALPKLKDSLLRFLNKKIGLLEFKVQSETLCRDHPYWGFKNFSGQMQLNQYANNVASENREQILRDALGLPKTREEVRTKINALSEFLSNLKSIVETPKSIPRVGQAFLLSYFWELQEPERWPVYYGSTKRVLIELGFDLDSQETAGDKYLAYVDAVESVKGYFVDEKKFDGKHPAWFVEHVLWKHFSDAKELGNEQEIIVIDKRTTEEKFQSIGSDFSSWVPSIVGDLPLLAQNIETDWSRERGVKPEKAFETKLRYAFTLLGYEVVELGQGTGREPDGYAVTFGVPSGDYAILYDAKAREKAYSIGTDDRNIFEYIQKYQNDLRRKRISKMSFVVVSSEFVSNETTEATIRDLYQKLRVPVILLRASDLMFLIETKLKNSDVDLARLESLFLDRGVLTRERISDELGG